MSVDRLKRAGLLFALAAIAGCASATSGVHDLGGGEGGSGGDLSVVDEGAPDQAVPADLSVIDQTVPSDLQVVCSVDAGDRLCGGKCITPSQCCIASDCPTPTNGTGICTNNSCGISCSAGYKVCGSQCIPNANCCVDGDCITPGDPCKLAAGATCLGSGVCNYPPVTCTYSGQFCNSTGACVCPTGQHVCQANASCIPDATCCTSNDCSAIAGQVCPAPGSTCTCLSGFKSCQTAGFSQCILATGCCSTGDCTITGQSCTGPGGVCQCPVNQKVCGTTCIPSANCCVNTECSSMVTGEICLSGVCQCPTNQRICPAFNICIPSGTCCVDTDCPLAGQHCSGIGGSCACPSGQHQCVTSGSCISNSNCCATSECTVSGQTCVGGPPGSCQCGAGQKICATTNSCIPSSSCCNASDCVPTGGTHVTASSCSNVGAGGTCSVTGCNTSWFDINKTYSDGCECPDTSYGKSCGAATALGSLGYGGSFTVTSQLPESASEQIWVELQFPSNQVNPTTAYHPQIRFTNNPGNEYVFDVQSNCSGVLAYSCNTPGDAGTAQHLTSFSVQGTNGAIGAGGGECGNRSKTGNCTPAFNWTAPVGNNGQVWVKIYRATTAVTCDQFTLVISD